MPTRGYRKGISDDKEPVPCSVRTHISEIEFNALTTSATEHGVSLSKILRALVQAFLQNERPRIPHARGPSSAALRELCRIGNNLNQIARQANMMHLPLIEERANACLSEVLAAVSRLR